MVRVCFTDEGILRIVHFRSPFIFKLLDFQLSLVTFFFSVATGFHCNFIKIIFYLGIDYCLCIMSLYYVTFRI